VTVELRKNRRNRFTMIFLSRNENDLFCELRRNEAEQLPLPIFTMLCILMSKLRDRDIIIINIDNLIKLIIINVFM
jgi:hypothetical protein